ncbi:MAG: hypothetical protein M1839_006642 [Geoglossum umbratile]|nr:MAG: hypothetical protein M1839_006642 [Geoglossum umbratile]
MDDYSARSSEPRPATSPEKHGTQAGTAGTRSQVLYGRARSDCGLLKVTPLLHSNSTAPRKLKQGSGLPDIADSSRLKDDFITEKASVDLRAIRLMTGIVGINDALAGSSSSHQPLVSWAVSPDSHIKASHRLSSGGERGLYGPKTAHSFARTTQNIETQDVDIVEHGNAKSRRRLYIELS